MKNKVKGMLRTATIIVLNVFLVIEVIASAISYSLAAPNASATLGTNSALGSPILNENFASDDWNKWEMICWGIFLSNFCTPLVDDYNSAFNSNSDRGSKGAGFKALQFGSGNDANNTKTIKDLLDAALNYQNASAPKQIYVTFSKFDSGMLENFENISPTDPNQDGTTIREATFKDFFLQAEDKGDDASWIDFGGDMNGMIDMGAKYANPGGSANVNYPSMRVPKSGNLPTFWIKAESGRYINVFDYCDPWDISMVATMFGKIDTGDLADEFSKAFEDMWAQDGLVIGLDCFGNITAKFDGANRVVFPGVCNQHLTKTPRWNLINSWVFNGYNSGYTGDMLVDQVKQSGRKWLGDWFGETTSDVGVPAMGNRWTAIKDGTCLLYFDSDDVAYKQGSSAVAWDILSETFSNNIDNFTVTPKLETANLGSGKLGGSGDDLKNCMFAMYFGSNFIHTVNSSLAPRGALILKELTTPQGDKIKLFGDPVAVAPMLDSDGNNTDKGPVSRKFMNFIYLGFSGRVGSTTAGTVDKATLESELNGSNLSELRDKYVNVLLPRFKAYYSTVYGNDSVSLDDDYKLGRVCVMYPSSEVMKSIGNVLGIRDGAEFSTYATYIYATYLSWYGISGSSVLNSGEKTSYYDPEIFDANNDVISMDINEITETMSREDLENQIKNYAYLMLNPDQGRDYRNGLISSGITDFLYTQYLKTVYGRTSEFNNGVYTSSSSGFLNIDSFADNFMTAAFMSNYAQLAAILIMVCIIAMIIIGLLRGRKLSWYFMSAFVIINTIILVPSTGEIVPYVANSFVQKMFEGKMTYWALSEATANAMLESQANSKTKTFEGMSEEESTLVLSVVRQINTLNLDRSLMIKKDISNKVLQALDSSYANVQNYQSVRWMLPMIVQQYSASDKSANYVWTALGNYGDDMSNMYWYYKPIDAESADTLTSGQNETAAYFPESELDSLISNGIRSLYGDYVDTAEGYSSSSMRYKSLAYEKELRDTPHRFFYYLPNYMCYSRESIFGDKYDSTSWDSYIDAMLTYSHDNLRSQADNIEIKAGTYVRDDRATVDRTYGYLWSTENPMHFFYQSIKDSFESDCSYSKVISDLQGEYKANASGEEVRTGFMFAEDNGTPTGYVRDILDLEDLVSNMIPYLYQMQITAGGYDTESGIFADEVIDSRSYKTYNGTNVAWLFRCNWATKIMENKEYSRKATIADSDGVEYELDNPMLASMYPSGRPMVFSEAQQESLGLPDSALNIVELKCIKVNRDTMNDWTLLLNYANMKGMTKEVLYRHMALLALLNFNNEFSGIGIINSTTTLYPTSVDLRSISFDTVMKMLMINVTRDASYIYGDTMKQVIDNSHMFQAVLILLCALICTTVIPFIRNILLGLILYLGFGSIIYSLFSSMRTKANIACGQFITNVVFLGLTICYYGVFTLLIRMTSSDEVLNLSTEGIQVGNPTGVLILILFVSFLYIFFMYKILRFCFVYFRDMGMEVYKGIIGSAVGAVSGAVSNLGGTIMGMGREKDEHAVNNGSTSVGGNESGNGYSSRQPSTNSNPPITINNSQSEESNVEMNINVDHDRVYKDHEKSDETIKVGTADDSMHLNDEIDKGKKIQEEEEK